MASLCSLFDLISSIFEDRSFMQDRAYRDTESILPTDSDSKATVNISRSINRRIVVFFIFIELRHDIHM